MINPRILLVGALGAYVIATSAYIYYLQGKKDDMQNTIKAREDEILSLQSLALNNQKALSALEQNLKSKDELEADVERAKERIRNLSKDKAKQDESINEPLRDSVDYIVSRLREANRTK